MSGEVLEGCDGGEGVEKGQKNLAGSWSLSWQKGSREFFWNRNVYIPLKLPNQQKCKKI